MWFWFLFVSRMKTVNSYHRAVDDVVVDEVVGKLVVGVWSSSEAPEMIWYVSVEFYDGVPSKSPRFKYLFRFFPLRGKLEFAGDLVDGGGSVPGVVFSETRSVLDDLQGEGGDDGGEGQSGLGDFG